MLTDLLLDAAALVLQGLAALLPEYELPYMTQIEAWIVDISGAIKAILSPIVPIDDYIEIVEESVTVWVLGIIAFSVALWFYRKIPGVGAS